MGVGLPVDQDDVIGIFPLGPDDLHPVVSLGGGAQDFAGGGIAKVIADVGAVIQNIVTDEVDTFNVGLTEEQLAFLAVGHGLHGGLGQQLGQLGLVTQDAVVGGVAQVGAGVGVGAG